MMEAVNSETSVIIYQTALCDIPVDSHLHNPNCFIIFIKCRRMYTYFKAQLNVAVIILYLYSMYKVLY
jgi:hypothetical protein